MSGRRLRWPYGKRGRVKRADARSGRHSEGIGRHLEGSAKACRSSAAGVFGDQRSGPAVREMLTSRLSQRRRDRQKVIFTAKYDPWRGRGRQAGTERLYCSSSAVYRALVAEAGPDTGLRSVMIKSVWSRRRKHRGNEGFHCWIAPVGHFHSCFCAEVCSRASRRWGKSRHARISGHGASSALLSGSV